MTPAGETTRWWPLPPDVIAPGGESLVQVRARVVPVVERLGRAHRGEDIVCISHGGPILSIVSHTLGLELERAVSLSIPNLSLTLIHSLHEPRVGGPPSRLVCIGERSPTD